MVEVGQVVKALQENKGSSFYPKEKSLPNCIVIVWHRGNAASVDAHQGGLSAGQDALQRGLGVDLQHPLDEAIRGRGARRV